MPSDHRDPATVRTGPSTPNRSNGPDGTGGQSGLDGMDGSDVPAERGPLAVIGLSMAEETAYELLLRHSPATLADLAAHWPPTLQPDRPLPELLAALVERGLADTEADTDTDAAAASRYVAVPPEVALDALLLDEEREIEAAAAHVERLAAAYRGHEPARPVTELVTGRRAVRQRIDALHGAARRELRRLCTDVATDPPTGLPTGSPAVLSTADSGPRQVLCRSVYARDALTEPELFAVVERRIAAGEDARIVPTLSLSLHLADDRLALLLLDDDGTADDGDDDRDGDGGAADRDEAVTALVVYPGALFDVLAALFEGLWDRATPLPPTAGAPLPDDTDTGGVSGVDSHLVALLLSGGTDQAIARQLGIAHRTLARRVAGLMTELGARTRFQAGVQAAFRDLGRHPDRD